MSAEDDRRDPSSIERRVDRLDVKIERVGDQVESVGKEMRSALEMLIKQQDERWKWFEQRSDIDSRNQKQAIELLTSSVVKLQQDIGSAETQIQMVDTDAKVLSAKLVEQRLNADVIHDEHLRRIHEIDDSLKWISRTLAASIVTAIIAVAVAYLTHTL